MSTHAPKQLAIEAYLEGLLSPTGTARLESHMRLCPVCRAAHGRMRAYHETVDVLREAPVPEVDWERIEASLPDAPAQANPDALPRAGRPRWLWPAVAVAAAALIGLWERTSEAPPREAPRPKTEQQMQPSVVAEPRAPIEAQVTLAANEVRLGEATDGAQPPLLDRTQPLRAGSVLRTGPSGSIHLRLQEGTGLVLGPSSVLALSELREGETRLSLRQGTVSCQVRALASGDRFEVSAGPHLVRVRGTRFTVARRQGHTAVQVAEGHVEVLEDGTLRTALRAGERWHSGGEAQTGDAGQPVGKPQGLAPTPREAWLEVPAASVIRAWLPAGELAPVRAQGALHMRLPPGHGSLQVLDRAGRLKTIDYELAPEGSVLTEQELRRQLAPPRERNGTLEVSQIMPVLQRGMGGLRACYERALRGGESGVTELDLQIRVATDGRVDQVDVGGNGVSAFLKRCVRARVQRWQFPPPDGGPAHLALPVNLRPRRR